MNLKGPKPTQTAPQTAPATEKSAVRPPCSAANAGALEHTAAASISMSPGVQEALAAAPSKDILKEFGSDSTVMANGLNPWSHVTQSEKRYIQSLERLWDIVSEAVEDGRISKENLPDDYPTIVDKMADLVAQDDVVNRSEGHPSAGVSLETSIPWLEGAPTIGKLLDDYRMECFEHSETKDHLQERLEGLRAALFELAMADGSSTNVASAEILASRVRQLATDTLERFEFDSPSTVHICLMGDWNMDLDGRCEARILVGRSHFGFHPAMEVSYLGGESGEPSWGDPLPTLEEAKTRAEGLLEEWGRNQD